MRRVIVPILLAVHCCLLAGCDRQAGDEQEFADLFAGYTLFRAGPILKDQTLRDGGLSLLAASESTVGKLVPNHGYAFRKNNVVANEDVALRVLPDRLRRIGAKVISAPSTESDLLFAMMGGPFFTIGFEKDGHRGTIFNRLVRSPDEGPAGSEVLVAIYR